MNGNIDNANRPFRAGLPALDQTVDKHAVSADSQARSIDCALSQIVQRPSQR
jgi:hypothetical protein